MLHRRLFRMLYAKFFARGFQRIAFVGQRKGERPQVEKMAAKLVSAFRLAGFGAFGDEVHLVGLFTAREALQRAFAVNVLYADPRAILMSAFLTHLVNVIPET